MLLQQGIWFMEEKRREKILNVVKAIHYDSYHDMSDSLANRFGYIDSNKLLFCIPKVCHCGSLNLVSINQNWTSDRNRLTWTFDRLVAAVGIVDVHGLGNLGQNCRQEEREEKENCEKSLHLGKHFDTAWRRDADAWNSEKLFVK